MLYVSGVIIILQTKSSLPIFQEVCDVFFQNIINSTVILEGEDDDE